MSMKPTDLCVCGHEHHRHEPDLGCPAGWELEGAGEWLPAGCQCDRFEPATTKIQIDTSDPETKAVWETAKEAAREVAAWPAWKRGELTMEQAVTEFHRAMGQPIGDPAAPAISRLSLRYALITEEAGEFYDAASNDDLVGAIDGLIDLLYVTVGTLVEMGVEIGPMFAEVHRSNLSKLTDGKPVIRDDGKVLKGPNYSPPDLARVLREQIERHGGKS